MQEKILSTKRNGMAVLLILIAAIILSVTVFLMSAAGILGAVGPILILVSIVVFLVSIVCLGGLKVLKPQEALVLTLFGEARATCTLQEHHEIYDAIAAGDAEKARKLATDHIIKARAHMFGA